MRVILAGTPSFASAIFAPLLEDSSFEILALICQPDKPFGRKGELKAPHTKEMLIQKNLQHIQILQPSSIDSAFIESVRDLKPDMILVVAYGKILPQAFLDIAPCVNIHASLLPQWRGASPIQQMLLNQPKFFGITAMKMNLKLDSGEILGFSYLANTGQNFTLLCEQLSHLGAKLAINTLKHFDEIKPLKQYDLDSSYCGKIVKSFGKVELENAKSVYCAYLAYCEWPHIFIQSESGYTLKLFDLHLVESTQTHKQGEILDIDSQSIIVGCLMGSLRIGFLQQEGRAKIQAPLYINGKRLKIGDILC
ncbi:methionyl-tRNA formyltransferase [Helicobacter cinaedi]|uniref:methionyl-tRNA formyltransferase n=1 Tax=Helicobacter cinaedi TaxID=213 RepID=UPI001F434EE9|nr:methionyl-tRNA formyltransferase [Helicobacter cinaedi]BDB66973.1 methionyl-tRNA formyltransferase [Helicobacter cinaedi]